MNIETRIDHNYHEIKSKRAEAWEECMPDKYIKYREKWVRNPKEHIVESVPIHLDIEATSKCNLLCTMCPRTEMIKNNTFWETKNFDFDLYKRIIDESAKKGLCSIKFNYLGEPLMNPKIIDMIEYAKDKKIIDVMFNTNATLLTEKMSYNLIRSGIDKIFFSFDSPYEEHYNNIRVNANYNKTLNNIKKFVEIRKIMKSLKPLTRVSMVKMDENEKEFEAFKDLFTPIVDVVAWVDYIEHNNNVSTNKCKLNNYIFCCPQLWQRMFIHPDGAVTVCCVDSARKLYMGNININKSVEEIWTGREYQKLRDLHSSGKINNIAVCSKCYLANT